MSLWAAGVGAAVSATSMTMGIVKGQRASHNAKVAAQLDAGARAAKDQEGFVDALFSSMEQGGKAIMAAGNQAIMAFLQALSITP